MYTLFKDADIKIENEIGDFFLGTNIFEYKSPGDAVNVASEANIGLFKKMIQEGDHMCDELKEMLAPEIVQFKIQLARQNEQLADKDARLADSAVQLADRDARLAYKDTQLADKDARLADKDVEIARLKRMLANMGGNA